MASVKNVTKTKSKGTRKSPRSSTKSSSSESATPAKSKTRTRKKKKKEKTSIENEPPVKRQKTGSKSSRSSKKPKRAKSSTESSVAAPAQTTVTSPPDTGSPSPSVSPSKVTRETYKTHVTPKKGKRKGKKQTDGSSPKRKKIEHEVHDKEVNVPEAAHRRWKPAKEEVVENMMNIVENYMKSLLFKTSTRKYDLVAQHFETLKHRLKQVFINERLPEDKAAENNNKESLDQYLNQLVDEQDEVDKAIKQINDDLDRLDEERDKKERSAFLHRPETEEVQWPNLQRLLGLNSAKEVRETCSEYTIPASSKQNVSDKDVSEKNELIRKVLSIYDTDD